MTSASTTARYFVEVDPVVGQLGLVCVVDRLGDDLGDPPDPVDAVVAFDHLGRGVRPRPRRWPPGTARRSACPRPGASRDRRPGRRSSVSVETVLATSSQALPSWSCFERGFGRRSRGRLLRGGRLGRARIDLGCELDDPGMPLLRAWSPPRGAARRRRPAWSVMPSSAASLAWSLVSMTRSSAIAGKLLPRAG